MRCYVEQIPEKKGEVRKINAIKNIRELTGLGLKDSKEIIDNTSLGSVEFEIDNDFDEKRLKEIKDHMESECGFILTFDCQHMQAMEAIKQNLKKSITLAAENEEPELLEVLAIAFKMVVD